MSVTQYVGARYVPLFAEPLDWDNTKEYEPLTIVYYGGNSYTSRQAVPKNVDISNTNYWALTGNYNAQIASCITELKNLKTNINFVTPEMFGAKGDGVTDDTQAINDAYNSSKCILCNGTYFVHPLTFNNVFLCGSGTFICNENSCITISGTNVIAGLTFKTTKQVNTDFEYHQNSGINCENCTDTIITDCRCINNISSGISVQSCDNTLIVNTTIKDSQNYSGIVLRQSTNTLISNTTVRGSTLDGIIVSASDYTRIYNSVFLNNGANTRTPRPTSSIFVDKSNFIFISDNTIDGNTFSCIEMLGSSNNTVSNNTLNNGVIAILNSTNSGNSVNNIFSNNIIYSNFSLGSNVALVNNGNFGGDYTNSDNAFTNNIFFNTEHQSYYIATSSNIILNLIGNSTYSLYNATLSTLPTATYTPTFNENVINDTATFIVVDNICYGNFRIVVKPNKSLTNGDTLISNIPKLKNSIRVYANNYDLAITPEGTIVSVGDIPENAILELSYTWPI